MKILLVSNWQTERCGVAEFGRQQAAALRAAGHTVTEWAPTLERHWPFLPPVQDYEDVIHVNFHPGTLGFLTGTGSRQPPLSLFKHEPPGGCTIEPRARWVFSAEQDAPPHHTFFPMPCVSYKPMSKPITGLLGFSSLRKGGLDWVGPVAERLGLDVDAGATEWLPIGEEVERLAQCEFLVYWYGGAYAGQSAGIMTGVAAERPILLNRNRMFKSLWPYEDELYIRDDLEAGMREVISDIEHGHPRIPYRLKADRNWDKLIPLMVASWRSSL